MKFDVIVCNPPYKKNLHLKFLQHSAKIAQQYVVFVQPARPFIDPRTDSTYAVLCKDFERFIESVHLVNPKIYFGDMFNSPVSITLLNKTKLPTHIVFINEDTEVVIAISDLSKLNQFSGCSGFTTFSDKVRSDDNLWKHCHTSLSTLTKPWVVQFSSIRGHMGDLISLYNKDYFTVCPKNRLPVGRNLASPKYNRHFEFDTYEEAANFCEYIKTSFASACLATLKTSVHIDWELEAIPWLDFTQQWSDEALSQHFALSISERDFVQRFRRF